MDMEKARRYLTEALHLSYGCQSCTCGLNKKEVGQVGTANLCRCETVFMTMIGAVNQMTEKETMKRNRDALYYCLDQIVSALPTKRDWLDPDLEKQCKTVLRICN